MSYQDKVADEHLRKTQCHPCANGLHNLQTKDNMAESMCPWCEINRLKQENLLLRKSLVILAEQSSHD